jgi:hypothetical protein
MKRGAQAHQAREVGRVCVEPQIFVRCVRPLVRAPPAEVFYVAYQIAFAVLRHQVPHVPAHSPLDNGGLVLAEPVIDGQLAQENKPQTVLESVHDVIDPLLEMRKQEILCPDLGDILEVLLGDMRERFEIGEVFFGETNDPATAAGELVASPYIRSQYRLGENISHRKAVPRRARRCRRSLYGRISRA